MQSEIEALRACLPSLAGRDIDFAESLLRQHSERGQLSPKQMFWVERLVQRATNGEPERQTAQVGDMTGVIALFDRALVRLKKPEIVIQLPGYSSPQAISVAGQRSKVPGSLNVVDLPTNTWWGRILRDGTFEGSFKQQVPREILDGLAVFAREPARLAAEHGRLSGRCCFCNIQLTDPRSTAAGYGETCARTWGLHADYKAAVAVLGKPKARKAAARKAA